MYATKNRKLIEVYRRVDDCGFCRREKNSLQHILGVGQTVRPRFALILINPTHLNTSSQPSWQSYRFPFIGVRHFWKVFHRAGIISDPLLKKIYMNRWDKKLLDNIILELEEKGIYLTNLVKCTEDNPAYPSPELVKQQLILFVEEINVVKPEVIICFGLFPFRILTGKSIRLSDYFSHLVGGRRLSFVPILPFNFQTKIYPCYFPVGRGNPQRAAEMIKCHLDLPSE